MMASEGVPETMAEAFDAADGELAVRLLASLEAGEAAGGDARGQNVGRSDGRRRRRASPGAGASTFESTTTRIP